MSEHNEYMKELDEQHTPSAVEDMTFAYVPDGTYQARLDKILIGRSKNDRLQCVHEFEILSGEHAHRTVKKFSQMSTAENLDYLTRDLRLYGAPVNFKWSEVQELFPQFIDCFFEIEIITKGEFQNIYVQKKLDQNKILMVDKPAGATTIPEDDVPF